MRYGKGTSIDCILIAAANQEQILNFRKSWSFGI